MGWGDIAPLPGFSSESLVDAECELGAVVEWLGTGEVSSERGAWTGVDLDALSPSVAFGLDTALASLWDAHRADSLEGLALPAFSVAIPVNGLLVGDRDQILRDGRALIEGGCRTLKLKLGMRSLADDVALTRSVRDELGDRAVIRLDANRCWSLRDAIDFGEQVGTQGIAYIEEPLADPLALPAFYNATRIPVALDESLRELAPEDLAEREDVGAVILKPTLMGSVARVQRWAHQAMELQALPVISASFESGVGILGLARLASRLPRTDIAVGLDTYRWLRRDVVKPRLRFDNGAVHGGPGTVRTYEVDEALLKEIRDV